ncbi:hypothetical protein [Thermoflavimicrobium dichotomicum]|uniref:Uncharacterized protein n=1 Tax=Thermoflavimicrobium dichotomicum TaxID=46223 RepID=A0A1I3TL42_9BACL|nr:hypothetical protein [Thermoflavimicrobium dichotomicum]SFJ71272.1 hypothetical protein SAMN05421852_11832 [Thermoflavimicrobium dichotomicum]
MRKNLFFIFIGMVIAVVLSGAGYIYYQQTKSKSPLVSVDEKVYKPIQISKKEPQNKKNAVEKPVPQVVALAPKQTDHTQKEEKEKQKYSVVESILQQWRSNGYQILVDAGYFVKALDAHYGTDDWYTYGDVVDVMYGIGITNQVIIDPLQQTPNQDHNTDPNTQPPNSDENPTADPPSTNEPPTDPATTEPPSTQPGTGNNSTNPPPTNQTPGQPGGGTQLGGGTQPGTQSGTQSVTTYPPGYLYKSGGSGGSGSTNASSAQEM